MDPAKTKLVMDWPIPSTHKELQCFLGFTSFYRRFIQNYSSVALLSPPRMCPSIAFPMLPGVPTTSLPWAGTQSQCPLSSGIFPAVSMHLNAGPFQTPPLLRLLPTVCKQTVTPDNVSGYLHGTLPSELSPGSWLPISWVHFLSIMSSVLLLFVFICPSPWGFTPVFISQGSNLSMNAYLCSSPTEEEACSSATL